MAVITDVEDSKKLIKATKCCIESKCKIPFF